MNWLLIIVILVLAGNIVLQPGTTVPNGRQRDSDSRDKATASPSA